VLQRHSYKRQKRTKICVSVHSMALRRNLLMHAN